MTLGVGPIGEMSNDVFAYCRAMAAFCRQRAAFERENDTFWTCEAEEWDNSIAEYARPGSQGRASRADWLGAVSMSGLAPEVLKRRKLLFLTVD